MSKKYWLVFISILSVFFATPRSYGSLLEPICLDLFAKQATESEQMHSVVSLEEFIDRMPESKQKMIRHSLDQLIQEMILVGKTNPIVFEDFAKFYGFEIKKDQNNLYSFNGIDNREFHKRVYERLHMKPHQFAMLIFRPFEAQIRKHLQANNQKDLLVLFDLLFLDSDFFGVYASKEFSL